MNQEVQNVEAQPISMVGAEEPKIHAVMINSVVINIAIELQRVVIVGPSMGSVNSEYRQLTLDAPACNKLLAHKLPCKEFYETKKRLSASMRGDVVKTEGFQMKNVSGNGLDYALVYYFIGSSRGGNGQEGTDINNFVNVINLVKCFHRAIGTVDLAGVHVLREQLIPGPCIGSKLVPLTFESLRNMRDLRKTIWKTMYISNLMRAIPVRRRQNFLVMMIDWGLISYPSKHLFTNDGLLSNIKFGSNIAYLRASTRKQQRVATELTIGRLTQHDVRDIQALTQQLVDITDGVDFVLSDLSMAMFIPNAGDSLYNAINMYVESDAAFMGPYIREMPKFRELIFQYFYGVLLVAQIGVIHNDPHLNNVLVRECPARRISISLPNLDDITFDDSTIQLVLIDFDKAVLSHYHHNNFEDDMKMISEEMSIVFDEPKKNIARDYNQVFNCYVMYDVLRFCFIMKRMLSDIVDAKADATAEMFAKHNAFLDSIIQAATDMMANVYKEDATLPFDVKVLHASIAWLIHLIFKDRIKVGHTKSSADANILSSISSSLSNKRHQDFVPTRRKYADKLKRAFIADYLIREHLQN